jgi:hypothetical protein
MDLAQRVSLSDEIFIKQPNLLASCLVQPRLGVTMRLCSPWRFYLIFSWCATRL